MILVHEAIAGPIEASWHALSNHNESGNLEIWLIATMIWRIATRWMIP